MPFSSPDQLCRRDSTGKVWREHSTSHIAFSVQVLAQRVRWSEGYQAPTNSQPAVGSAEANTSTEGTPAAATTVSDLLEYRDPRTGLTPLMASVVKGYFVVVRQVCQ